MDWNKLHEILDCDQVTGLQEFLRQHLAEHHTPEKFVSRDDFCQHVAWQNQQRTAEWNRLMEHSHGTNGEVVFPTDDFHELSSLDRP
jgi:hypothetical protein